MSKRSWSAASEQNAKIADEVRPVKAKALQPDEAVAAQPREAEPLQAPEAVEPQAQEAVKSGPVKRTSTSLYLTPAAHREIRLHAADKGLKSNQVYEAALKLYFKKHGLGDFDKLNSTAS